VNRKKQLNNSHEQTGRKSEVHENWSIRRHQDGAIGPCGDGGVDVKGWSGISSKALDFRHFLDLGSFKQVEMVLTLR